MLKATTGMVQSYQTTAHEQYSIFPRALADEEGNPHKSAKSNWMDKLQSQYLTAKPPVVVSTLPQGWLPQLVILDAMQYQA